MLREGEDDFERVLTARRILDIVSERSLRIDQYLSDVIGCAELLQGVADKLPEGDARTALFKAVAALWDRTPWRTYRS